MPHNRGNSGNKDKQKQTSEVLNESRETLYGTDRPNDPLSNSMFFQFMTRLDDRLKTIETNVTKSVGELDDIKKTVRSISGTVTTVQNEVKELSKKYVDLETHTQGMSNIFDNVRSECSDNSKAIKELDQDNISICTHMESLAEDLKAFKLERNEMKSTLLDLRCRSMKNNLVFTGLRETAGEETEAKLRDFLRCELNIDYYIEFGNVHRFGSRQNNTNGTEIRPRPIVARFLYYNDLAYVLECAKRLRGKPYGINQQFPAEIENRRRSLYPVMKEAKNRGKRVKLVRDRLFINNEEYVSEEEQITLPAATSMNFKQARSTTPVAPHRDGRPEKRPRIGSTPERPAY